MNKKQPKNAGQRWDECQRDQLRGHIKNKMAVRKIAEMMERTEGAIRSEIKHMEQKTTESTDTLISPKTSNKQRATPLQKTDFEKWKYNSEISTSQLNNDDKKFTDQLLNAWLVQEVLTPQSIPKKNELKPFDREVIRDAQVIEPWNNPKWNRKADKNEQNLFWFVCIGLIDIASLSDSLRDKFPSTGFEDKENQQGQCCSIVLVLNEGGFLIDDATHISSFVWGAGKVLNDELDHLSDFPSIEKPNQNSINVQAEAHDNEGNEIPITRELLVKMCDRYISEIKLPNQFIEEAFTVIRVPSKSKQPDTPTPEFLNSFFISDLDMVINRVKKNNIGEGLKRYLLSLRKYDAVDIRAEKNKDLLKQLLQPCRTPLSRWVGRDRHPLSLMQQATVNHAIDDLSDGGVIGVNGPPGTGKTTLLRDVVAEVVFQRACVMTEFNDPNHAFKKMVKASIGNYEVELSHLDHRLHGFEIVVASANNKAVENISLELPELKAVCDQFEPNLTYYKTVADAIASGKKKDESFGSHSWGLSAAVLGNSRNRNDFVSSFWFNDEYGFRSILESIIKRRAKLNSITGDPVKVVQEEKPPLSKEMAINNWKREKKKFLDLKKGLEDLISQVQMGYEALPILSVEECNLIKFKEQVEKIDKDLANERDKDTYLQTELTSLNKKNDELLEDRKIHSLAKPDLLSRIIAWFKRTDVLQDWLDALDEIKVEVKHYKSEIKAIKVPISDIKKNILQLNSQHESMTALVVKSQRKLDELTSQISLARDIVGDTFADQAYWDKENDDLQKSLPWSGGAIQALRDQIFESSWAVHKAFIEAAAEPIKYHLSSMMELLKGKSLDGKEESVIADLWATMFMVVPVISTTFASVTRLLDELPREAIGWLLIDEAGQALPQQAVGAIYRSKRTIVMGDPLQIPPVTSSPKGLLKAVFQHYNLDADLYAAPNKSAQYFADQCSWIGCETFGSSGDIWIGMPLNVHRRCEDIMFNIANNIAYGGEMIQAVKPKHSAIGSVLGESRWIDIKDDGRCNEKWSPTEGMKVLKGLTTYITQTNELPDLYIITPFKMISNELRQLISKNEIIINYFKSVDRKNYYQLMWVWISSHVGTVHTFQGKEAEAVFFVLGASLKELNGARVWAGGTPNILNVAVTRAKQRLYIVGNHAVWSGIGVFQEAANLLRLS